MSVDAEVVKQAVEKKMPKFGKIQFVTSASGIDWKTPAVILSVASALVMGALLVKQWNYAAVGRNVTNDVVKFLELHGAKKKKGVIHGGMVQTPMTVTAATTQIVAKMLGIMNKGIEEETQKEVVKRKQEEAVRLEEEKNKSKPKLCYDSPKRVAGAPAGSPMKHEKKQKKQIKKDTIGSAVKPPQRREEPGSESDKEPEQHRVLFEPEDTRAMMKGNPEPVIEPYTPPMPIGPKGSVVS